MKSDREKLKGVEQGNLPSARDVNASCDAVSKNLYFSTKKGISFYLLLSKGWFPSFTLSLLTTVLGVVGIFHPAKAEELSEQPNLGTGDWETLSGSLFYGTGKEDAKTRGHGDAGTRRRGDAGNPRVLVSSKQRLPIFSSSTGVADLLQRKSEEVHAPVETVQQNVSTDSGALDALASSLTSPSLNVNIFSSQQSAVSRHLSAGEGGKTKGETDKSAPSPLPFSPSPNEADRQKLMADSLDATQQPNAEASKTGEAPVAGEVEEKLASPAPPAPPAPPLSLEQAAPSEPESKPPDVTPAPNDSKAEPLASGTIRILTPQSGVANTRSTNLVIQYNAGEQVQVSVNQKPLDPKITTQQNRDEAQNIITQAWYNIPLEEGENTLTVQAGNGTPASVQVTVKETALKLEIAPVGDPRVAADGRSTLTLQGRITDENGQLLSEDTPVTLTASAGKFVGADQDEDQPGFQVMARGGQFTAQLQSSLEAQKVQIRAAVEETREQGRGTREERPETDKQTPTSFSLVPTPYSLVEAFTQVQFITNLRPSLVSGVIDFRIGPGGTNFWGRRADFLGPDAIDDGTQVDFQAAVFATGRIGEWLLTGAYNSARNLNETCDGITRLFRGPQFCEQQYPVYGDSSTVDYLTPSIDSVYVRLERTSPFGNEPDYVMWGDYSTSEFARESQLFTATVRQLHGFKGNYNFGNLQLTALYSGILDGFQRDTIAPNGTSGYYFLSRRRLVPGSENVFIETEEANRPGTVISRKPLNRNADYEVDYDRGTLMFRRPVLATEFAFFDSPSTEGGGQASPTFVGSTLLVRRIVVTYQYDGAEGGDTNLYAGRVQYNFSQAFQRESWIGTTYLRQDQGIEDFELYGADFRVALGTDGQIVGEYAHSYNSFVGDTGSAYRLEGNATILPGLTGRAYYRSVEENFANNATLSFTPGQTRYGGAIAYSLGTNTTFRAGYDYEENFGVAPAPRFDFFDIYNPGIIAPAGSGVNNSLETISAGILQKFGGAALSVDYVQRNREDRVSNLFSGSASQLVSRLGLPLTEALTFRAQNELSFGDNDPLYPNRTTLGLDWNAYPGVTLRLAHQFFDGGILGSDSITSFDTILSHNIWENTTITGRYSIISGFNELVGQGAVGLNHRWVISPGLRVNLGYEHTFSNTSIPTAAGVRFAQPYAVGQSAASLALLGGDVYSVGVEYTDSPDFKASARFEHRTGSGNDNTLFSIAGAGKLSPALTVLARYEQANFANQLIEGLKDTANLRVGLAYRDPNSDRWNALLRYEYRKNPSTIPETLLFGTGTGATEHVFAGEAIYAPSWRWEFYGKGAVRYSDTELANNFSNSSTIFLGQLRAAYRLNYRMDLAVEGRWIGQNSPSYNEVGLAVETGYYLTPDLRIALGYSFGGVDDRDFTGYRSEGGVYFGVTFKLNELLGGFGRQRVVPPQQQESRTKPVATDTKPDASSAVNTSPQEPEERGQNLRPGF